MKKIFFIFSLVLFLFLTGTSFCSATIVSISPSSATLLANETQDFTLETDGGLGTVVEFTLTSGGGYINSPSTTSTTCMANVSGQCIITYVAPSTATTATITATETILGDTASITIDVSSSATTSSAIQCDSGTVTGGPSGTVTCDSLCGSTSGASCSTSCLLGSPSYCATELGACTCPSTSSSSSSTTTTSSGGSCTELAGSAGLIPCGRKYNDPNTVLWNECDPCTLCSLILMAQLIIEFLVKIAAVITTLTIVAGGLLYVFSGGQSNATIRAKSVIKYALIGFVIVFIAWAVVDSILATMGYIDPLAGEWYTIC